MQVKPELILFERIVQGFFSHFSCVPLQNLYLLHSIITLHHPLHILSRDNSEIQEGGKMTNKNNLFHHVNKR